MALELEPITSTRSSQPSSIKFDKLSLQWPTVAGALDIGWKYAGNSLIFDDACEGAAKVPAKVFEVACEAAAWCVFAQGIESSSLSQGASHI